MLHIVGYRTLILIDLNAHANFVSVLQPLVLLLIDHVGFQRVKSHAVNENAAADDLDKRFAIAGDRLNDIFLQVHPRHAPIRGAITLQAELGELILDDRVADNVQTAVIVTGFYL